MTQRRQSPLGLILLLNLVQRPSHAYRLHKLLEQTGKGRIVNIKSRASVYQAIERLRHDGLVEPVGTSSEGGYPDRVEYMITDQGRLVAIDWLRELVSTPGPDSSGFIAALSTIFVLAPDDARNQLEARQARLISQLEGTQRAITGPDVPPALPQLFLLDELYRQAMLTAELAWTEAVIADLADGRLSWSRDLLDEVAARFIHTE